MKAINSWLCEGLTRGNQPCIQSGEEIRAEKTLGASQVALVVKNPPGNAGDSGSPQAHQESDTTEAT